MIMAGLATASNGLILSFCDNRCMNGYDKMMTGIRQPEYFRVELPQCYSTHHKQHTMVMNVRLPD
jgi:hypothetical protein